MLTLHLCNGFGAVIRTETVLAADLRAFIAGLTDRRVARVHVYRSGVRVAVVHAPE